jgi:ferritin-like metal-binding protein YciE
VTGDDEYLTLIEDCENRESKLSDWQRTFIDSLRKQIEQGKAPTPKQIEKLDEAWEQATKRG